MVDTPEIFDESIRTLNPVTPICVEGTATLREVVDLMQSNRIGCVLITEGGRLEGILTERDLTLQVVGKQIDFSTVTAREVMTPDPETLRPDHPIAYALNRMSLGGYRHIPLVDNDGNPEGIISVKDIVDYVVEHFPGEVFNLPPEPDVHGSAREGA